MLFKTKNKPLPSEMIESNYESHLTFKSLIIPQSIPFFVLLLFCCFLLCFKCFLYIFLYIGNFECADFRKQQLATLPMFCQCHYGLYLNNIEIQK